MEYNIQTIKTDKINFSCKSCGNCCCGSEGAIWVNDIEQSKISEALGLEILQFKSKYTRLLNGKTSLKEIKKNDNDYWCVFLDEKKKCSIYNYRPEQCRTFPYWKHIIENEDYLNLTAKQCQGIKICKKK